MNVHERRFSTSSNLFSSSNFELEQVMEHLSNQDVDCSLREIDNKSHKIATDLVQSFKFLLIRERKDQTLTIYRRKGFISSIDFSEERERDISYSVIHWSISYFNRIFLAALTKEENWRSSRIFINEFVVQDQIWTKNLLELPFAYGKEACKIKNRLIVTENKSPRKPNIIEFLKFKDDNKSLSSTLSSTCRPGNATEGYSITSILGDKIILAGGATWSGAGSVDFRFPCVYEGTLDEDANDMKWKKLDSLINARSRHAAIYQDSKLFVFGGTGKDGLLKSSEAYVELQRRWSIGTELPYALTSMSAVTNESENFSLILGYEDVKLKKCRIFMFEIKHGFTEIASIEARPHCCSLVEISNK